MCAHVLFYMYQCLTCMLPMCYLYVTCVTISLEAESSVEDLSVYLWVTTYLCHTCLTCALLFYLCLTCLLPVLLYVAVFYISRKQKSFVVEPSVFTCVSMLAKAVGPAIMRDIKDILEPMLAVGLRYCSVIGGPKPTQETCIKVKGWQLITHSVIYRVKESNNGRSHLATNIQCTINLLNVCEGFIHDQLYITKINTSEHSSCTQEINKAGAEHGYCFPRT